MNASGQRLRDYLDAHGTAYADFAKKAGVDPQHVNNWFRRGVPKARVFEIADLLGVDPRWLVDGNTESTPRPTDHPETASLQPLLPWDSSTPLDPDEVEVPLYKEVEIAAGGGIHAQAGIRNTTARVPSAIHCREDAS